MLCCLYFKMKGSAVVSAARLQPPIPILTTTKAKLLKYDRQQFYWGRCIGRILSRPNSFMHERKCQEDEELMQKYFSLHDANKEINQLVEYYRFYKNSPTLAHIKHLEFMGCYWNKKKSLYYKGIKRQLQIQDQMSSDSAEQHVQEIAGKYSESLWTGTFQLPSQLNPSYLMLQSDPDATIRRLLLTMSAQKQHKSTREVSKIADFQQKSVKSHLKSHMKTNPSQLVSISDFKKSKKKVQHKSMSNEPKHSQNKKSNQKKLNPTASCQRLCFKQPEIQLNYQRRNKQKEGHKESNKKRLSNTKQIIVMHKKKEGGPKKGKSGQKSVLGKSKSGRKSKDMQTSGRKSKDMQTSASVKAVIDRVKDKIKAQKNVMMKKYIQSRQSCKSNDSTHGDTVKRLYK